MTDPADEAESDGERAQKLPVSAAVKSASLITRELDGCLAPNQHRVGSARPELLASENQERPGQIG